MELIKLFLPIIIVGTIFLILIMLPTYFIRKKKNPYDSRNTILRLVILAFLAMTIMTLFLGSGLIRMYFDDLNR